MMHKHFSRIAIANAASLLLVAGLFAAPAVAKAPSANLEGTAIPQPDVVSQSTAETLNYVRFDVWFHNKSNSNYATFFVTAVTPDKSTGGVLEAVIAESRPGSCSITAAGDLTCSFGALTGDDGQPGGTDEVTFSVVYRVPVTPTLKAGQWVVPMTASSNGSTGSDTPGQSHGDDFTINAAVVIATGDQAGTYIYADTLFTQNGQSLDKRNPQSTKLVFTSAGEDGFPASVDEKDAGDVTYVCPPGVAATCFGQWSVLSANYGEPVDGGITVVLGYDKIAGQPGDVRFVHLVDTNGDGMYTSADIPELIPSYNDDPCSGPSDRGCVLGWESIQGDYFFTLILTANGPMRGY